MANNIIAALPRMRFLLRPAPLFVLSSYLLLSLLPCLALLLGHPAPGLSHVLAMQLLAWLAVWGVLGRPVRFHWLTIPAFLALPTEMYLLIYYGRGISTHHLGIIAETSPREALDFLGSKIWLMGAVLLGVIAWWGAVQLAARRSPALAWRGWTRWAALGLLVLLAGVWAYGAEFGIQGKPPAPAPAPQHASASADEAAQEDTAQDSDPEQAPVPGAGRSGWHWPALPWRLRSPLVLDDFASSWPFGLAARGVDFYKERAYLAELGQRSSSFTFHAHQSENRQRQEIVIVVIGESARYDRWGINGYARDTTPLLKQEANLVTLPDMITAVSATRLSVPVIISRKPAMQSLKDGFYEKSFLTAYKEAGFKTWWLSNQISFGQFDTPVSVFASEADVIQFMNLGGYTNNSNFDQILLQPLQHAMADPSPKKLIVLHTLGNHWNYSQRYPKEYDKWQPSLFGVEQPVYTDTKIKPQLNNSYDNAILYTDWFLAQVIKQLKDSGQLSSMVYVADHGQTLYDGTCNLAFHGHNTQYEFHVPAMLWYSDEYQAQYPEKVRQLLRHRKARLATENMFHTLLDLGDIQYDDQKLEWSFLNQRFRQHKRYVDSYGWSNYDNASFKGDCREVIDKGKPLKQEK
jgi:glucan phosphoethanolaminetransferase (alkaline phosphatase superfamily)